MNVILNAYACGPNRGSEIGLGWNYLINLSNYCQIFLITEQEFKDEILNELKKLELKFKPNIYFIDVGGENIRKICWNQGDWRFYYFYNIWQKRAYQQALKILSTNKIDIIHQLNMIGFREPGYLWKIKDIPFVWGPVGGLGFIPFSFLKRFPINNFVFYFIKNFINNLNLYHPRIKKVLNRSDLILSATIEGFSILKSMTNQPVVVFNETGSNILKMNKKKFNFLEHNMFRLIWIGKIYERKELNLALHIVSKLLNRFPNIELHIIGDGPGMTKSKILANKIGIESNCFWYGYKKRDFVLKTMENMDLLIFTSIDEGTPHVVLESISKGLPVICHDTCGQGSVVDNKIGLKVEVINPIHSIKEFEKKISDFIINFKKYQPKMSYECRKKSVEFSWDNKSKKIFKFYKNIHEAKK